MRCRKFFDWHHAYQYLVGSMIRFDNEPVMVQNIEPNNSVTVSPIIEFTKMIDTKLKDDKLDFNPVPLGYVNYSEFGLPTNVFRCYRVPARQWRVGLTDGNAAFRTLKGQIPNILFRKILLSKPMRDTICNEFPSFYTCITNLNKGDAEEQAFSRRFALTHNGMLMYNQSNKPVGSFKGDEISLYDDYAFLSQLLERDLQCHA